MDMIELIQISLFIICIIALVFIFVRSQKRDVVDITEKKLQILQQATLKPIGEETAKGIKKKRWIWSFFAFWIWYFATRWIVGLLVRAGVLLTQNAANDTALDLWNKQKLLEYGLLLVGIALIVIWIIYDVIQTKKPENKYMVPAYVQSTFTNPKHRTRSAQFIYYDYKQLRCRLKIENINRYERKMGRLNKGDMVYIIVEEGRNRVNFLSLVEERVEKELLH